MKYGLQFHEKIVTFVYILFDRLQFHEDNCFFVYINLTDFNFTRKIVTFVCIMMAINLTEVLKFISKIFLRIPVDSSKEAMIFDLLRGQSHLRTGLYQIGNQILQFIFIITFLFIVQSPMEWRVRH